LLSRQKSPIARRTNEPKAFWGNVFNLFWMFGRHLAELFERAALGLDFAKLF
jgi:hypothetical protein